MAQAVVHPEGQDIQQSCGTDTFPLSPQSASKDGSGFPDNHHACQRTPARDPPSHSFVVQRRTVMTDEHHTRPDRAHDSTRYFRIRRRASIIVRPPTAFTVSTPVTSGCHSARNFPTHTSS